MHSIVLDELRCGVRLLLQQASFTWEVAYTPLPLKVPAVNSKEMNTIRMARMLEAILERNISQSNAITVAGGALSITCPSICRIKPDPAMMLLSIQYMVPY